MSDEGEKLPGPPEQEQSGSASERRHRRDKRFVGVLLIIVGILFMVFGGGCSLVFLIVLASEYGWDSQMLVPVLIIAALFAAGLFMFRKGVKVSRKDS
jgi:uncharacterized membrane protein